MAKRLPRGFKRGHDDSIKCPHRDLSCCRECIAKYVELVDVHGRHFWMADANERAEWRDDPRDRGQALIHYDCDGVAACDEQPLGGGRFGQMNEALVTCPNCLAKLQRLYANRGAR